MSSPGSAASNHSKGLAMDAASSSIDVRDVKWNHIGTGPITINSDSTNPMPITYSSEGNVYIASDPAHDFALGGTEVERLEAEIEAFCRRGR